MAAPSESLFSQWLAAGSANALTSALFNPIDAAKTRIQTSTQPESLLRTLRAMAGASTVSAAVRGLFFPGLPASMIREMLSSGPRAGFYVPVRDAYLGALGGAGGDAGAKVLAAMTTGSLGGLIANPIDVVKVRLMIDPTRYSTTLGALRDIGRDEGVGGTPDTAPAVTAVRTPGLLGKGPVLLMSCSRRAIVRTQSTARPVVSKVVPSTQETPRCAMWSARCYFRHDIFPTKSAVPIDWPTMLPTRCGR